MVAAFVLATLLVELGVYAALVCWLWLAAGVPPTLGVLAAGVAFVALRFALVSLLGALARRWRAAASPPLGAAGFLRLAVRETHAFLQTYMLGQVLQRWLAPRDPAQIAPGVTPVLFVHGIYCNAGVWHRQLAWLQRAGTVNLFHVNLAPPLASIDRFAAQLAQRAEDVCRACGVSKVIIVAHSMGGLAARAWLARLGGRSRVARLITIGSPHHGSRLARFAPGRCAAEMVPGSAWLTRLQADEAAAPGLPLTCIASWHDSFVAPQDSALLPHASSLTLEGRGHLQLLLDPQVHRRVAAEISAARSESPS
jgi:pimeloyl-ACP methyl ester carboxylesterase